MQESASFWTTIKQLEEQLAKSPESFCFARLSEVYLKVGLVEDALHVARQGVTRHPSYLSGQRALSLACNAKGYNDEAIVALKLVTEALPEDISSQKVYGHLLCEAGNQIAAAQAFRTALEFAPDDVECRVELEALQLSAQPVDFCLDTEVEDEAEIEDLEILDDLEIFEDEPPELVCELQNTSVTDHIPKPYHQDPFSTGTLAELYVSQGFIHKALDIYRAILSDNPDDATLANRVAELDALAVKSAGISAEYDESFDDEGDDDLATGIPAEDLCMMTKHVEMPLLGSLPVPEPQQIISDTFEIRQEGFLIHSQSAADNALSTFFDWLENIRKIKLCR